MLHAVCVYGHPDIQSRNIAVAVVVKIDNELPTQEVSSFTQFLIKQLMSRVLTCLQKFLNNNRLTITESKLKTVIIDIYLS